MIIFHELFVYEYFINMIAFHNQLHELFVNEYYFINMFTLHDHVYEYNHKHKMKS